MNHAARHRAVRADTEQVISWDGPRDGDALRVALVHSFYTARNPSGENRVVEQQLAALRRAGCSVELIDVHTDDLSGRPGYAARTAVGVATGRGIDPTERLLRFGPDVVHVHNLFPNYGRSWVSRWNGPLVATMHNYRPLCPGGTFFRDGRACTDCLHERSATPAVRHACYRGSRLATLPLAVSTRFTADPVLARADRVITLSSTARELYSRAGVPGDQLTVIPNFVEDPGHAGPGGDGWIYVGRFSSEKGVLDLVRDWPAGEPLLMVGDGPLRADVEAAAPASVTFAGQQPPEAVRRLVASARGLVFPSKGFEAAPTLVYLEALAAGTPVLAWRPSAVADAVVDEGTGLVVDDLPAALADAKSRFPAMRHHCRRVYEENYTEQTWAAATLREYESLTAAAVPVG